MEFGIDDIDSFYEKDINIAIEKVKNGRVSILLLPKFKGKFLLKKYYEKYQKLSCNVFFEKQTYANGVMIRIENLEKKQRRDFFL